jgi:Gpi18-like mannosyltransferase
MSYLQRLWLRLPEAVRWGLFFYLVARLILLGWGVLVMTLLPFEAVGNSYQPVASLPSGLFSAFTPWIRWDVNWYVSIAVEGYSVPDGRGAFLPLYPLLIRLAGTALNGQYFSGAALVSDLACLGSLILLYDLAQREVQSGRRTLAALLIYPFAFFLFVSYSEALLVLCSLAAFWAARRERWWLVGVFGALAVLTKVTAFALLPALALEWWQQRKRRSPLSSAWLLLIPLAMGGWMLARQLWLGGTGVSLDSVGYGALTPVVSADYQAGWKEALVWPWEGAWAALIAPFQLWPNSYAMLAAVNVVIVGVVAGLVILSMRLPNRAYPLYAATLLIMNLMLSATGVPLIDVPRRMLSAFPIFIAAALYVPERWAKVLTVLGLSAQLALSAIFVKRGMIG